MQGRIGQAPFGEVDGVADHAHVEDLHLRLDAVACMSRAGARSAPAVGIDRVGKVDRPGSQAGHLRPELEPLAALLVSHAGPAAGRDLDDEAGPFLQPQVDFLKRAYSVEPLSSAGLRTCTWMTAAPARSQRTPASTISPGVIGT